MRRRRGDGWNRRPVMMVEVSAKLRQLVAVKPAYFPAAGASQQAGKKMG
ncbi:hypothetical protein [Nitrosospira multiformis]|nr:hypothetical protein [Nitrosospira multiformis]